MKYFIIAGEASGDLHASNLIHALKEQDAQAQFMGLGGDLMAREGVHLVCHYRDMAYMGFITVIRHWPQIKENMRRAREALSEFQPDVLILVDYPSFNLRMARYAKKYLHCKICYYISPKLWAWKTYRIHSIKRYIDHMYCIFPFETDFYAQYGYQVEYVGNPTQEVIDSRPEQSLTKEDFTKRNGLPHKPFIALLAGSRKQEIRSCLPTMLAAVAQYTDYQPVIAGAPGIEPSFYTNIAKDVPTVFDQTYLLLQSSMAAVVNSGTATLETALIGIPQVVVYHIWGGRLTYWLKNQLIKTRYISLVNIIIDNQIVKELVAHLFTANHLSMELHHLLHNDDYRRMILKGYAEIRQRLGNNHAADTTAHQIVQALLR